MQMNISERLLAAGYTHKRTPNAMNTGKHFVTCVATGEVIGEWTAFQSLDFLNRITVENFFGKQVRVSYLTINQGNGDPDEQEDGELEGVFSGESDIYGRTIRYHLKTSEGDPYFIFADEITEIEELAGVRLRKGNQ
jgi:hypothetical protein